MPGVLLLRAVCIALFNFAPDSDSVLRFPRGAGKCSIALHEACRAQL